MELRLEIHLNGHVLYAILGLPPILRPILIVLGNDILDAVTVPIWLAVRHPLLPAITEEAFGLVLQVGDDTITLSTVETTRRRSAQTVLTSNQKISRRRIATVFFAQVFFCYRLR